MESVARGVLGKHRENRRDPFHVLGNPRNLKDARQSFRKLALLLHPDKCGNEAHRSLCEEAFKGEGPRPRRRSHSLGRTR